MTRLVCPPSRTPSASRRRRRRSTHPIFEPLESRTLLSHDPLAALAARGMAVLPIAPTKRSRIVPPPVHTPSIVAQAGFSIARQATPKPKTPPGVPAPVMAVPGEAGQVVGVTVSLIQRATSYRNEVGLFRVDDAAGKIGNLKPGDRGYAAAALARRVVLFQRGQDAGAVASLRLRASAHK